MADNKIAVVIYEKLGNNEARVYRGLKTALEFKEAGDDVVVVFDGSGVESLATIIDPNNKMNGLLGMLGDSIIGACSYCTKAHNVLEPIQGAGYALLDDNKGEASIRNLVNEGRQVFNF